MARIRFTSLFSERIGGISSMDVAATTVESALRTLTDRYPALRPLVWSGEDVINPVLAVFLNDQLIGPKELRSIVEPDDTIDIIAAVAGG